MRRPFVVVLKNGRETVHFNTVARSESEALRIARRFHPRKRHVETRS